MLDIVLRAALLAVIGTRPIPEPTASPALRAAVVTPVGCPSYPASTDLKVAPSPPPDACNNWLALIGSFAPTRTSPNAGRPVSTPFPQIDGSLGIPTPPIIGTNTSIQATAFDALPGIFGKMLSSAQTLNDPTISAVTQLQWFQCALCVSTPGQQQPSATQTAIQPPLSIGLPPSAVSFANVIDLTTITPSRIIANFVMNPTTANAGAGPVNSDSESVLLGFAHGSTSTVGFNDGYLAFESRVDSPFVFNFAAAITNHVDVNGVATHASDSLGTFTYCNPNCQNPTRPNPQNIPPLIAISTLQYGSQDMASGENITLQQQFLRRQKPSNDFDAWNLLVNGEPHDYTAAAIYVNRGTGFTTPDADSGDSLVGLHGFGFDATYLFPFVTSAPARLRTAGYSFSDVSPRFRSALVDLLVPFSVSSGIEVSQSVGSIAASAAAPNFGFSIADGVAGGSTQIGQRAFQVSFVMTGSGPYAHFLDEYVKTPVPKFRDVYHFIGVRYGAGIGFANVSSAECGILNIPTQCASVSRNQFSFSGFADGGNGFIQGTVSPGTLPSGAFSATIGDTTSVSTPSGIGSFLNKASWAVQGGYHIGGPAACTTLVVAANNTVPPPELQSTQTAAGLSISEFLEVQPTAKVPMTLFVGAAHTIANVAIPSATGMPPAAQFQSTVTYAVKLAFGYGEGYRYNTRQYCGVQRSDLKLPDPPPVKP